MGWAFALGALAAGAVASCGDDESTAPVGPGGAGGSAGAGGDLGCDGCEGVCVEDECLDACPGTQQACSTEGDAGPDTCCNIGMQCCPGGPGGPELCRGAMLPCPAVCDDGTTICEFGTFCLLDTLAGTWSCADQCPIERTCESECCPLGSRCEGGQCLLPDITIDTGMVTSSFEIRRAFFDPGACELNEGCIGGPGERTLLLFSLKTPNIGEGDLFLGDPNENDQLFQFSPCHNHFHFSGYADYRLLDASTNQVATGHKQAFCLLDLQQGPGGSPQPTYDCSYQGISTGWADIYDSGLPCQWVDITDVAPGDYQLELTLNGTHILAESDYDNDQALVPVTIPVDSCPQGCKPFDPTCCDAADPCGWTNDGSCDCLGQQAWDAVDCASCYGGDPDCVPPASQCVGCTPWDPQSSCCSANDICGWAGDGYCDCGGMTSWDVSDCQLCMGTC